MRTGRVVMPAVDENGATPYVTPSELGPTEVEIFRLGTHAKYPSLTFTADMADRWIANNKRFGMPQLVIGGHDDGDHVISPRPIQDVRRVRNSLVATCGTQPRFVEDVVRMGMLPHVSIQLSDDESRIEHVDFLWRERPASKGHVPTHVAFSARTPPSITRPALRFSDDDVYGGYDDSCCAEVAPIPVTFVPTPPSAPDVAGEIAAEDRRSFIERVMDTASRIASRFAGNPGVAPADQARNAAAAYSQAATLIAGSPSASPSAPSTGDGESTAFSEEEGMDEKALSRLVASAVGEAMAPLQTEIASLKAENTRFSEELKATTAVTTQQLSAEKADRALRFSESLLQKGTALPLDAQIARSLHLALNGTKVTFGEGDAAKQYDGADLLETLCGERKPQLQFGSAFTTADAARGTTAGVDLNPTALAAKAQILQDSYSAKGVKRSFSECVNEVKAGVAA